ncbi:P27 family phage terminase small subunit [Vagococcus lutrae]|uniref:P27 family phage terminase small subunit n=1 Tax=Vagococcus lutrae TaxID=81947 RepID=UPI00288D5A07|nr:P27 family phage terminase small subunit [Vagococcus lutrae]MDT2812654.1 P27 family phage terminase small subunit [Vagococcus lutrae]
MAKDGTNRGGARIGAGAKKKALVDKITEGNPGGRTLTIMEFQNAADLEGVEMPEPSKMLEAVQKDGKTLVAGDIYRDTWNWLNERGCAALISPQLLERYAMSVARWIQCEEAVTEFGFLAKHPTTGNAMQSPYVAMSQNYMTQTNRLWLEIFQIVKENSLSEYTGNNPQDNVMERLLTARTGK